MLHVLTLRAQSGGSTSAPVTLDLHATTSLRDNPSAASYELSISDCTRLVAVDIDQGSGNPRTLATTDLIRTNGGGAACAARFDLSGARQFQPSVNLRFNDGTAQTYSEAFSVEDAAPELKFDNVALSNVNGDQYLNVTVTARDDIDMSSVTFDVTGLLASDLRAAGGVIEAAKPNAFAKLITPERVRPTRDGQLEYTLSFPVAKRLSADQIAHDGVVMMDVAALDASGNEARLSRIVFTGGDVKEEVQGLHVNPTRILFTSLLESATVIPTVDFQFRGPTALPGIGTGVTYESSHPALVAVSRAGVVTPIAETNGAQVRITVGYPGTASLQIPVEVNQSKHLVRLETGEPASAVMELPRLNAWFTLPPVFGVFDDGSRLPVTDQFPRDVVLDPAASGILSFDPKRGLNASAVIPPAAPLKVTLSLRNQPEIKTVLNVTATDGAPQIRLACPTSVSPGEALKIAAVPKDDVGVAQVEFVLNDGVLSQRDAAPYELSLQISEQSLNQVLRFRGRVWDTAGQSVDSDTCEVRVVPTPISQVPELVVNSPTPLQRVVENRPIRYEVGKSVPNPGQTGTTSVEFYVDDTLVGESRFPIYQFDQQGVRFELWRFETTAPEIATHESSRSVYGVVHAGGATGRTTAQVFRIVEDQQPSVAITAPLNMDGVAVGQSVPVTIEAKDDTLGAGLSAKLLLDEQVIGEHRFADPELRFADASIQTIDHFTFQLPIEPSMLGRQLSLRASVMDEAGQISESENVNIVVRGDQAPSVAISAPVEGSHQIGGQPLEIRANATDDIGVERVDFYVDGRLVGSDSTAPYAVTTDTTPVAKEQRLTVSAQARDAGGHVTTASDVHVTLGKDEQPPVINIVSPTITGTEGGADVAEVVEKSTIVLKIAGYDNIEATRLELRGVRKNATGLIVTGAHEDVLTGTDLAPQSVPGALHAFSALRLVDVPAFSGAPGVLVDHYPIEATAWDAVGNKSTAAVTFTVRGDQPPVVVEARAERSTVNLLDTVRVAVFATDDLGVDQITTRFFLDNATTPIKVLTQAVVPAALKVQQPLELDLAPLALSNADHVLYAEVTARDNRGKFSAPFSSAELRIPADHTPPVASLFNPVPGSQLYSGDHLSLGFRAVDDTRLKSVELRSGATSVQTVNVTGNAQDGTLSYTVPDAVSSVTLTLVVKDYFGNVGQRDFVYAVTTDAPPKIDLRAPPPGSRMTEGEAFTLTAAVTDNRRVSEVTFFARVNGQPVFTQVFNQEAVDRVGGGYFSVPMRVPHRGEAGELPSEVGVLAKDDRGQTTQALLELDILDDLESPVLRLDEPNKPQRVMPGNGFLVKGAGDDNFYIGDLDAILRDAQGVETKIDFKLSRTEHVEKIEVPNPGSFGRSIVAERFYLDYQGKVEIPKSLANRKGERFSFFVRGRDNGYNPVDTQSVQVEILGDEEAPQITFNTPKSTIVQRPVTKVSIGITDNVELDNYSVYLDNTTHLLKRETGVGSSSTSIGFDLDTSAYDPVNSPQFTLFVEAQDKAGNKSTQSLVVRVLADQQPVVELVDSNPETSITAGALAFQTVKVTDDSAELGQVSAFSVYTSFADLDLRAPQGLAEHQQGAGDSDLSPYMSFVYPEAATLGGRVTVGAKPCSWPKTASSWCTR
jgi:hypothetical protein